MGGFENVNELCNVAVFNIFESFRDECADSVSVYSWKRSRDKREKMTVSGTAGHLKDEVVADIDEAVSCSSFEPLAGPVFAELTTGSH